MRNLARTDALRGYTVTISAPTVYRYVRGANRHASGRGTIIMAAPWPMPLG
jgi:hypothetical protein